MREHLLEGVDGLLVVSPPTLRTVPGRLEQVRHSCHRVGGMLRDDACERLTFGATTDGATSGAILDAFAAAGRDFVDIFDVYAAGLSEQIVGRWMHGQLTDAHGLVIATKGRACPHRELCQAENIL